MKKTIELLGVWVIAVVLALVTTNAWAESGEQSPLTIVGTASVAGNGTYELANPTGSWVNILGHVKVAGTGAATVTLTGCRPTTKSPIVLDISSTGANVFTWTQTTTATVFKTAVAATGSTAWLNIPPCAAYQVTVAACPAAQATNCQVDIYLMPLK